MSDIDKGLGRLNSEIYGRYKDGEPLILNVRGQAVLRIVQFEPLIFEPYGRFRNRGPHIGGRVALMGFMDAPTEQEDIRNIIAAVDAGVDKYGVPINDMSVLNKAIELTGLSGFSFYNHHE